MTIERRMFPPRAESVDSFPLQPAIGQRERESRASESGSPCEGLSRRTMLGALAVLTGALPAAAGATEPTPPDGFERVLDQEGRLWFKAEGMPDPIFAAIKRHRAASVVWNAAVDARSEFPEGPEPLTDKEREQRDMLDDALATARGALDKTGVDLIRTEPTTLGGIASVIGYIQRQMRDDGTFMPFDIEFHYDVGYEGDSAVVFGWLDVLLNTIDVAVSELAVGKAVLA
jgi:hypothetical protein